MNNLPHVIITAGGTSEPIDAVRCWGNLFTGQTGIAIALAVCEFARVTLLLARSAKEPTKITPAAAVNLEIRRFTTGDELAVQLEVLVKSSPAAIFMTAAVGDYKPIRVVRVITEEVPESDAVPGRQRWVVEEITGSKIKSDYEKIAVLGIRTPKIIDRLRRDWRYGGLIYKFKLEADVSEQELIRIAEESRQISHADVIVANTLEMVDEKTGCAWVIDAFERRRIARHVLAKHLAEHLYDRLIHQVMNG